MKELVKRLYRMIKPIVSKGENNTFLIESQLRGKSTITVLGNNNIVIIGKKCLIKDVNICIYGDNNCLEIHDNVRIKNKSNINFEGNAHFEIRKDSGIGGISTRFKDGHIVIGERCMFSVGVLLRNYDGHCVTDNDTGKQTNFSGDISIGNHVWICENASIIKKCEIGENSIVAYGSVVTKGCNPNSILAGNPAKIVKEKITWEY